MSHIVGGWGSTPHLEEQNTATCMPKELRADDGRVFHPIKWSSTITKEELTVTATFKVEIND